MTRHDKLIICDAHLRPRSEHGKIIMHGDVVNDGKTILPGYVSLRNGIITEWYSQDPGNRIVDDNGNPRISTKQIGTYVRKDISADFCNKGCYGDWRKHGSLAAPV
jgi:hypothetical protein